MSVYSSLANQIAGWLLVSVMLALGGSKALHTATVARRTEAYAKRHITQRMRYTLVGFGLLCTAPIGFVFIHFGFGNVVQVLGLTVDVAPFYGWALVVSAVLAALHLVLAPTAVLYIFFRPSPFASYDRKTDTYVPTVFKRLGINRRVLWLRAEHIVTDKKGNKRTVFTPGNATYYGALADRHVRR